jgi:hypothetical protein
MGLLFVGDDWAEEHHDVELQNEAGRVLGRAKLPEGVAGIAELHAMIGEPSTLQNTRSSIRTCHPRPETDLSHTS